LAGFATEKWSVARGLVENPSTLAPTVEAWLLDRPYKLQVKEKLQENHNQYETGLFLGNKDIKFFVKDELYEEFKAPRGIVSLPDIFKTKHGPLLSPVEKVIYANKHCVKHIPIDQRPDYLVKELGGALEYIASDYSSFESTIRPMFRALIHKVVYERFMTYKESKEMFEDLVYSVEYKSKLMKFSYPVDPNNFDYHFYDSTRPSSPRKSGEMQTSLENWLINSLIIEFCAFKSGARVDYVCEGDDGLIAVRDGQFTFKAAQDLGFLVKEDRVSELHRSAFCGMVFDEECRRNMANPIVTMLRLKHIPARYARASRGHILSLYKAKALSYLYCYPGMPLLTPLCLWLVKTITADVEWAKEKWIEHNRYYEELFKREDDYVTEIALSSRLLMYEEYGIDIDSQLALEEQLSRGVPLTAEDLLGLLPDKFVDPYTEPDQWSWLV
jgi:hypothetical protein